MSDMITREAAIEALEQIRYALWEIDIPSPTVPEYIEHHRDVQNVMKRIDEIRDKMERLPSAQSEKEIAKRVLWTGWKGRRDTRYKCPNCKKLVKNDDIYCHRCGQKLMFPKVDWTPYVEGQKQELIVRWDDE